MIPGMRPTWNSAITGTRYTNCGSVCIPSSSGFNIRWTRSLRADQIPTGIPIATLTMTARITWASVSIALSHCPTNPITAMQTKAISASVQRRAAA